MNMQNLTLQKINLLEKKNLASRISCLILIGLLIMYLLPLTTLGLAASLIAGGFAALILAIHFFIQSRILNIILGGIMFLGGIYFSLAVVSEFNDFETVTHEAWQLIFVGLGLCFSVIVMLVTMIRQGMSD